jgi:hypothetical protein
MHDAPMRVAPGAVFIILIGCKGSGAAPDVDGGPAADAKAPMDPSFVTAVDGSRIKARWAQTGEGQRIFVAWYDTMLKTDCSFRRAADGEYRCLPLGFLLATTPVDYADPACTAPAAVFAEASCDPPAFIRRPDTTNSCESRERVYARGERIADGVAFWRPDGPTGECKPGGVLETSAAFRLGGELPVSMFVKGKTALSPAAAPGLAVAPFEIEDGAKGFTWLHPRTGTQCTFWALDDGRSHCFPQTGSLSTVSFAEATCAQPAAYFLSACGAPEVLLLPNTGTCPLTYTPHALGPRLDTVYRITNGTCGASAATIGNEYHTVGDPAAADDFPPIEYVNEDSGGRLRRRLSPVAGGRKVVAGTFYDSSRQETCVLFSFGPGKFRCAPSGAARLTYYFADSQCTQPLLAQPTEACAPRYAFRYDNTVCPARALFYTVGPAFTGQPYVQTNFRDDTRATLECRAATAVYTPASLTLYSTTDLPEDQLAELQRIDPR